MATHLNTKKSRTTKSTSSLYCGSTTTEYDNCHTSPQSTSEKYYCTFVGDLHAGLCEAQTIRVALGSEIYFDDQQEVLYRSQRYESSNFRVFVLSIYDGGVLEESKEVRREGNTTFLAIFDNHYTIAYYL